MTGCAFKRYEQFETSSETIELELWPAVLLTATDRQTDMFKGDYSID